MRLLDVNTYKLNEFIGDDIPPYAILSHTWAEEEVLYRDIEEGDLPKLEKKHGFKNIQFCTQQAKEDGLLYCWVDTCCINKSSSAELSAAINSMYSWYKQATVCYVYLEDMSIDTSAFYLKVGQFSRFRWFGRRWTLQEMIAPQELRLYNKDWVCAGDKSDYGTLIALREVTGVPIDVIRTGDVGKCCIAQRMSWASGRRTTRIEDRAYSLLGLLNVNMPLIYGEGEKAFLRLQKEIMENSDDDSIFAWEAYQASHATLRGLLARSPDEFQGSKDLQPFERSIYSDFRMTQNGVRGTWPTIALQSEHSEVSIVLNTSSGRSRVIITLAHLGIDKNGVSIMARVDSRRLCFTDLDPHIDRLRIPVREWIVRQNFAGLTLPTCKLTRIAGLYMDFDIPIQLDETSPPDCLVQDRRIWRFTEEVLDTLRSQNTYETETTSIEITTDPRNLVIAKFKINLATDPTLLICAFNLSKTQSSIIDWAENTTLGPLESWSCRGLSRDGVFEKFPWASTRPSLQVVDE